MMVVNYIAIACFLFVSVNAQMCSLFCGPGQKCEYVGSQPMCVPYQGGIIPGGGISGWNRRYGGRGRHAQGGSGWLDPFMGGGGTGMVGMGMGGVGTGMVGMGGVGTGMGMAGMGVGGVGTGMVGMGMGGVGTGIGVLPPVVPPVLPPVGGGNVGVVNPGGVGPAVVDDRSRSMGLNLNVQNTNVNQHTHSGSGGTQVNKPGVIPVPVPVPVHGG